MASTVAILAVRFIIDGATAVAGIDKVVQKSRLAQSGLLLMGLGAAAAAGGIATLTTKSIAFGIQTASDMQQAQLAMTALIGSADTAKKFLSELYKFAVETPFSMDSVIDAARRLMAVGFSAQQVIPLLKSVGDVAAGLGVGDAGIHRITLALGQMHTASHLNAQDMRQLTELGVPAWQILAQAMHMTVAQVQELTTKGKIAGDVMVNAFLGMTGPLERFRGMMDVQSKTLAGQWAILTDTVKVTAGQIFTPIVASLSEMMPAVTAGITKLMNAIGGPLQHFFTGLFNGLIALGPEVTPIFSALVDIFKDVFNVLKGGVGPMNTFAAQWRSTLFPAIMAVMPQLKEFAHTVASQLVTSLVAAAPYMLDVAKSMGEWIKGLGPVLPMLGRSIAELIKLIPVLAKIYAMGARFGTVLIPFVGALIVAGNAIQKFSTGYTTMLMDIFMGTESAGNVISTVWNAVAGFFVGIWNSVASFFVGIWNNVVSFFTSVWSGISGFFASVWNTIVGIFQQGVAAVMTVVNFFKPFINLIVSLWQLGFEIIKTAIIVVWQVLYTAWVAIQTVIMGVLVAIWTGIKAAWNGIVAAAMWLWQQLVSIWNAISGTLMKAWHSVADPVAQAFVAAWHVIAAAGLWLWHTILQPMWEGIMTGWNKLKAALGTLKDFFIGVWNGIKDGVSGVWNWIIDKITAITDAVKTAIGKLKDIQNAASGIGDFVRGLIPGRALGGPVLGGQPYIVGENGPEMFVPAMSGMIMPNSFLSGLSSKPSRPVQMLTPVQSRPASAQSGSGMAQEMAAALAQALAPLIAEASNRPIVVRVGSQDLVYATQEGQRAVDRRG